MDKKNVKQQPGRGHTGSRAADGSAPAYSAFEKDGGVFIRVPQHDEWGNTSCVHGLTIVAARELIRELKAATDLADSKIERRHRYEPNKKYPWFCRHCGYAEHEPIMHLPNAEERDPEGKAYE